MTSAGQMTQALVLPPGVTPVGTPGPYHHGHGKDGQAPPLYRLRIHHLAMGRALPYLW
jgi:hypothetical protein